MTDETMRAAVLYGQRDVRVERVRVPDVGLGEVRLRIGAALTCGTDLKVYRRGHHARMITPPALFGHEFAGTIEAMGEGVSGWQLGQRVVAANSAACDQCFYCERGNQELCEDLLFVNGAYAEYITLPERIVRKNLLPLTDNVSFEAAALTEPLACAVRGFDETGVVKDGTVVVIGVGPIGLMFVRLFALTGMTVLAVGRSAERLNTARLLGAQKCFSVNDHHDIVSAVRAEAHEGRGPDIAIECVGVPDIWEQAIGMVRKGGTVNLFGGCPNDTAVRVDTARIHYDEITIKGTFHHTPATIREALRLITSGDMPAETFLGSRADLSELPLLLERMDLRQSAVKTVISPHQLIVS